MSVFTLDSDKVVMFPSGYRATGNSSRFTTEENLSKIGILTSNNDNYFIVSPYNANQYLLGIHGYIFQVNRSDIENVFSDEFPSSTTLYAYIKLSTEATLGNILIDATSDSDTIGNCLDTNNKFVGLAFTNEEPSSDDISLYVQLYKDSKSLVSKYRLDTTKLANSIGEDEKSISEEFTSKEISSDNLNANKATITSLTTAGTIDSNSISTETLTVSNSVTLSNIKGGNDGSYILQVDVDGKVSSSNLKTESNDTNDNSQINNSQNTNIKFLSSVAQASNGKVTMTSQTIPTATSNDLGLVKGGKTSDTTVDNSGETSKYGIDTDGSGAMTTNIPWKTTTIKSITSPSQGELSISYNKDVSSSENSKLSNEQTKSVSVNGLTSESSPKFKSLTLTEATLAFGSASQNKINLTNKNELSLSYNQSTTNLLLGENGIDTVTKDGSSGEENVTGALKISTPITSDCGSFTKVYSNSIKSSSIVSTNIITSDSLTSTTMTCSGTSRFDGKLTGSTIEAQTFVATSDMRLKKNIKEYHCDKSILDLPIKEYDFIEDSTHHIGCLAQDLEKICPELVSESGNGYLTIEENKLVYLLLDEVKKLRKEVDELKRN